jgi:hypothetical protein
VLVVYLYRAQQRIASRGLVRALTGIRVALLVLMFVLLGRPRVPVAARARVGRDAVGVDRPEPSMAHVDRQMTPAERLHWADALDLLPPNARPGKLGRHLADLSAVRAELAAMRDRSMLAGGDAEPRARINDLAGEVQAWHAQLQAVAGRIEQEPAVASAGAGAGADAAEPLDALRTAAADVKAAAEQGGVARRVRAGRRRRALGRDPEEARRRPRRLAARRRGAPTRRSSPTAAATPPCRRRWPRWPASRASSWRWRR